MESYVALDALDEELLDPVERLRYYSEQDIDYTTWDQLQEAYTHFIRTGDDSKYPIVLEDKTDGYFVIG